MSQKIMKQFDSMLNELGVKGISVKSSRCDAQTMGSWFIETASCPCYRIVHDGRDKTIVLEVLDNKNWNSVLADKTKSGKHVLKRLIEEIKSS